MMPSDTVPEREPMQKRLLDAMIGVAAGHGWTEEALAMAIRRAGLSAEDARAVCPRGIRDLAVAFHRHGDHEMIRALDAINLASLPFPSKVAEAVWQRSLAYADCRLALRALIAHSALPSQCADGARLTWQSAHMIWNYFGHTERDLNWYTKRLTLAAVLGSTTLYLVGDNSDGLVETRGFIDRRIADVMRIESVKAKMRNSQGFEPVVTALARLGERIRTVADSRSGYSR